MTHKGFQVAFAVGFLTSNVTNAVTAEKYIRWELPSPERLKIYLSDGSSRLMSLDVPNQPTDEDDHQVAFSNPLISPDGTRVGWLALYPNCCTSYPLPLGLIIYSNGRIEARFSGIPPIWNWSFSKSGGAVYFCQRPPHGDFPDEYTQQKIGHSSPAKKLFWDELRDPANALPDWAKAVKC